MFSDIFKIFGIETDRTDLIKLALTHPSYVKENNFSNSSEHYERLEFLGDAVLKLAASCLLYKKYKDLPEGQLSKIRSFLVSDNFLAEFSFNLGIDKYLILSKSEEKCGGRKRISNNACALEALFGAFYLAGKEKEIQDFIINLLNSKVDTLIANLDKYNAKEYLQEYTQMSDKHLPVYNLVSTSGPAHKPIFEVEVLYNNNVIGVGSGLTKKLAEQNAAYEACLKLGLFNKN